ncbi:hypothetical protein BJ912DRAFT_1145817 [Pholiota molesta]|nr:hypothetical protein BJ912DRAFT_1145817 [Pholiota molesta]
MESHNIYSSVHLTFGETSVSVVDGEPQVTIKEDPKGWSGSSSLIATFYLPSWTLCNAPAATKVGLHIRSTLLSIQLKSQLGMRLAIFSTPLTDATHIQVVRHRPGNAQEVERLRQTPGYNASTASESVTEVTGNFSSSGDKAVNLVVRKEIADADAASSLASGIKVVTKPLTDSSVLVIFGDHKYRLRYPFPVQMKRLQMRIARKSSFIELETPVRPDFSDFRDLSLNPFAVANDNKQINLLNIHYLKLDLLPAISLPGKEEDLDWPNTHIALTLSKAETEARLNPFQPARGTFVNVKDTTACLFLKYAGLQVARPQDWSNVFGLSDPLNGGVYTYIFVNAMKLDLGSHTIVLDACVVPLADRIMPKLSPAFDALRHRHFVEVMTHADEKRMWTLLLPLLAERCRTWQHTDACEYRTRGVPASLDVAERSPLCSCGKGKNLGRFGTVTEWAPFRDEATRVAIGPLFPFSFPGAISSGGEEDKGPSKLQCTKCRGPGKPQLLVCTACKKTQYCSRECQKADWKVHKKICAAVGFPLYEGMIGA